MKQNIDRKGRAARGILFLLGGASLVQQNGTIAVLSFLFGLFAFFEALRGWCAVRACGSKRRFDGGLSITRSDASLWEAGI